MSEGPIEQWRDGFKVPRASTNPATAVHMVTMRRGIAFCGRRAQHFARMDHWEAVTCADCLAARAADLRESDNSGIGS